MSRGKWSLRTFITKFKHEVFYGLIRYIGPWAAYSLLYVVVFGYSLRPTILRRSRPYLGRRFPGAGFWKNWQHSFRLNISFGLVLLERAIMGLTGRMEFLSPPESAQIFRDLLAEGRGLIVLSAHVGAWQTALGGLAQLGEVPVNIVQLRLEDDVDRHYFEHGPGGMAPRIIDAGDPASALLLMTSALLSGEVVCLMGDRVPAGASLTVTVPFLGDNIQLPGMPFYLAAKVGAPVAVALTRRLGKSRVGGEVCQVIRPEILATTTTRIRAEEVCQPLARQFTLCLEQYTAAHPYQFFNFYDMWRSSKDN